MSFAMALLSAFLLTSVYVCSVLDEDSIPVHRDALVDVGDVTLGVTLVRPGSVPPESLPAIVLSHGSAPSTRSDMGFYEALALKLGFAVVSYDKRGVGLSTGEYEAFNVWGSSRNFNLLADDLAAVVAWTAQQPGVDGSCIGLMGGSQAGWIMPLAVHKGADVGFVVIGEGTLVSAGEEEAHGRTLQSLHGSEFSTEITLASLAQADRALQALEGEHGYDPLPVLQELDVPMLWFFGLRDHVIPVMVSLERLQGLIRSGRDNHAVHIFPFGDHNFTNQATGERYNLEPIIARWLEGHVPERCIPHFNREEPD